MIQIAYHCPRCDHAVRQELGQACPQPDCHQCGRSVEISGQALTDGQIHQCLVCSSPEMFVRKDFPQRLGVTIVLLGFAISCVTWYDHQVELTFGVLFATALVDVLLYVLMPDVLECYRCHAQYRGVANLHSHGPFALQTHEKYRQQAARQPRSGNRQMTTGST